MVNMIERIDKLRELKFGQLMDIYVEGNRENGALRYPHLSESEQLLAAEQDFYQYLTEFFNVQGSFYVVLSRQNRYVSALRMEPYKDGFLLEALETKPCERRKGYAEELIRRSLLTVKKETGKVYSHVSKNNLPSISVHEKCGFCRILDKAVYIDGSVNNRAYTYCYQFPK